MIEEVKKKIFFWGTPEFALPALEVLLQARFRVAGVVTKPDEPKGRKQELTLPPVKVFAQKHGIPVFQPEKLEMEGFKSEILQADLFIIAAYGKIIPKEIIDLPRFGSINIHPSLLPRWRGPSPIQHTILFGDEETGVSIIKIDELMDHGPLLAQRTISKSKFPISKITYLELHNALAKLGADLLIEALPKYLSGEITLLPQDDSKATFCKMLKRDDGRINWQRPAEEIERMVRAFNPWPGTWTLWPTKDKILRIKIEEADWIDEEPVQGSVGFTWSSGDYSLLVRTGKGSLVIKKAILESKGSLGPEELIRGYPVILGTSFI